MYIQASLMFIYSLNVCTCGAVSMTAFVMKNRSGDVIAVVAIVLLLAVTRNLMLRCVLADIVLSLRWDPWS